jgi:SAM-dependent methyltransferase
MIAIEKYLPVLCDPVSRQSLELCNDEAGTPYLLCNAAGLRYDFVGDFPDLRPNAGISVTKVNSDEALQGRLAEKHQEVMQHYHDKPCNNYLALDNLPLGHWLRDPQYRAWFDEVDFAVEVGSGKGAIARVFKEYRQVRLFCIDLAYGSLKQTRFEPLVADGALGSNLRLPLRDGVADLVVSHGVIHHTPDPIGSFSELARVLKPGG